jgi:hypothetical protein
MREIVENFMEPKNTPSAGQWAEQQKIADKKQQQRSKKGGQQNNTGQTDRTEPQSTPLEPESQGGISGP